jgi:hypothetical protein
MPLIIDSVPVTITIASASLQDTVAALPQSPLLFVAAVESCDIIDAGPEFHIQLAGNSATLITTEYHAAQMGLTAANAPGLTALLERQAEFLKSADTGKELQR